jgi:hypothetical protein
MRHTFAGGEERCRGTCTPYLPPPAGLCCATTSWDMEESCEDGRQKEGAAAHRRHSQVKNVIRRGNVRGVGGSKECAAVLGLSKEPTSCRIPASRSASPILGENKDKGQTRGKKTLMFFPTSESKPS